jgi:transposase
MSDLRSLPEELRAGLPPAVQTYLTYLEGLVRSSSVLDVDLETASREELVGLIFRLLERQQVVEGRLRELERLVKTGKGDHEEPRSGGEGAGPGSGAESAPESAPESARGKDPLGEQPGGKQPPEWVKPSRPTRPKKDRKKREHGSARRLDKPTHRVEHAYAECPECQIPLQGGKVSWRRQVISLPRIRVRVTEHVVIERRCEQCGQTWRPVLDLSKEVVGQQRIGISVQSEVAVLREGCRLPYGLIQRYLSESRGLHLSVGELVNLTRGVAERGQAEYEGLREELRKSPAVNGDETGWREDGQNGYLWSFSTPKVRYYLYRKSRAGTVVEEVLGEEFDGVVVSDFYGAYNVHRGEHQRCWTHLLRAIHELRERYPADEGLLAWAKEVKGIYERAKAYPGPDPTLPADKRQAERVKAQRRFEQELWLLCEPYVKTDVPMRVLCERIERFLPELFVFVADPRVPADNNLAERSLRGQVVSRKISGGTRSGQGSETKSIVASLFGTWQLQGRNLYAAVRQLLGGSLGNTPTAASVPSPPG